MTRIKLGDYNQLEVVKEVDFGMYLDAGDDGEVLLPKRYVPKGCKPGDSLNMFLYLDQDERLVATTQTPLAKVGEFACLDVSWVNEHGAFLNWGLMKDLFCPFREQKQRMEMGESYVVAVFIDEESYRIAASAKVEHFFANDFPPYQQGDEVDLLVWQTTDLGFKMIVDNAYPGLAYRSQVFRPLHVGDRLRGYIMDVRPDGKIDISLQPLGRKQTTDFAEQLLQYLKDNNGYCNLGDKSDAEDIKRRFAVSKKVFKKAVGDLYKRRLITIEENGLRLVN